MNTRRNFVRGLSGLGAIVATGHAPAIVKSMIAARGTMLGGAHAWTNPYVTDGLIAMWDGEWNAGGGVHDASTTVWKDLAGNRDFSLTSHGSFGTSYLACDGLGAAAIGAPLMEYGDILAIEAVFVIHSSVGGMTLANFAKGKVYSSYNMLTRGIYANASTAPYFLGASVFPVNRGPSKPVELNTSWSLSATFSGEDCTALKINNVSASSNRLTGAAFANGNMALGARSESNDSPCECDINTVRLYSRTITAEEIAANYRVDKKRFNLAS